MAIAIQPTIRDDLFTFIGPVPASAHTKLQRVYYAASLLRAHPDGRIAAAATSCYDGSLSRLAHSITPLFALIDLVLERAGMTPPDPEPEPPAPLPEKASRQRWERRQHYHQAASAQRAAKRGLYVVNRGDEWAAWNGWDGGGVA